MHFGIFWNVYIYFKRKVQTQKYIFVFSTPLLLTQKIFSLTEGGDTKMKNKIYKLSFPFYFKI